MIKAGKKQYNRSQQGFSLLEVLLVVGLMTAMAAGAATIFDEWFKGSINRKVANEIKNLHEAAEEYVTLNMEDITTNRIPNLNDVDEITIAELVANDFLPVNYIPRSMFNQQMRVFIRHADTNTIGGIAVEVFTASQDWGGRDSRMEDRRLFDSALAGGPKLGLISAVDLGPNCCNGEAQSAYGEWEVDLTLYSTLYNVNPSIDAGGYMAAYSRVSFSDIQNNGYFLYRAEVPDEPQLNRMMTNLDMNDYDIVDAGAVIADNMNVTGNAVLEGQGSSALGSSPYVLSVASDFDGSGNLTLASGGTNEGDLIVQGDANSGTFDFVVNGDMAMPSATGNIYSGDANVTRINTMGNAVFQDFNVNDGAFTTNNTVSVSTAVNGNVTTNFLQTAGAGVATINAGNAVTGVANIQGAGVTVNDNLVSENSIVINGSMQAGGLTATGTSAIQNMTSCGSGCPLFHER